MLILLPPSEGKSAPARGRPLDLDRLDFAELTESRAAVLTALLDLCAGADHRTRLEDQQLDVASSILGLGPTQTDLVRQNARLLSAPTARADRIYTGVLYDALDLASLTGAARGRATRWLGITSSLFGIVRPSDQIPPYRLSGDTTLPGLGRVATHWRSHLGPVVEDAIGHGLLVDLRSTTYASFWRPDAGISKRVATLRVLHEANGTRKVVSHFNKATKGRLVRELLLDGGTPRTPAALADHLSGLGWKVEPHESTKAGHQLDVIVDRL